MVHVDVPKVRGKMAEKGFTLTSLSEKIGVSRGTLACYLDTPEKFPYAVVSQMAALLCDDAKEATYIFFADDLRST